MAVSDREVLSMLESKFGITGELKLLPGELDLNYMVRLRDGKRYLLKVANASEDRRNLELQNAIIKHLTSNESGLLVSDLVRATSGEEILTVSDQQNRTRLCRLFTWIEGRVLASVNPHSPALLEDIGRACGSLCKALHGFDHPHAHRTMKWDPSQAVWTKQHLSRFSGERKRIVEHFYRLFEAQATPLFSHLRKSVNYNDANDYNVLVSHSTDHPRVAGVIDFGDAVYTHTVNELAIAIAYVMMHKPDPLEAAWHVVRGFNSAFKLTELELTVLYPLACTRLVISVVCAELNRIEDPQNEYLQISDQPAWKLLEKLMNVHPAFAEMYFREACGLIPCSREEDLKSWMKNNRLVSPIDFKTHAWIDLSIESADLGNISEILDAEKLNKKLSLLVSQCDADVVLGKYDEPRAIYSTDAYRVRGNDGPSWRTVHVGLDFFCSPGTKVKAAFKGKVHSFANNSSERDYGPTIVLEHRATDDLVFYTLYGHLTKRCLDELYPGKEINDSDVIGEVGERSENGNWTPHLHFQVMLDTLGNAGDFPGVCAPRHLNIFKSLCPDPWFMLTGQNSQEPAVLSKEEIISFRSQHVGKNLSVSYKNPIKMVRGAYQYLIDETGRKYLDTVNNVAHVGHEHARVVTAGQRQMAVLNTNTRYLHDNLVRFVEQLLATMPPELNVAYVVNSGSEANELAIRIAKNYTGQKDMIVSEVGYHGNTNACIEISSYKFDGPGGRGSEPHIHVIPIPDTYRGLYRADDQRAGSKYAEHVDQAVKKMAAEKRKPAALIFESVISCGGQVELPENFLQEAYAYTRAAGGVCIADEVQTGCGRAGDAFWAFQQHDVVPDIVTIGKPIGNGHPLGVVVTRTELADAFRNGMEYFNTFGGNPVSCAIGLEVLNVIKDEQLQENARVVGNHLRYGLRELMKEFEIIGDVRGPGLFIGFELVKNRITKEAATAQASYFANRMRDKGILMSTDGPYNNVIKVKPPVIFSKADSDYLLESIYHVLREDHMQVECKKINIL